MIEVALQTLFWCTDLDLEKEGFEHVISVL